MCLVGAHTPDLSARLTPTHSPKPSAHRRSPALAEGVAQSHCLPFKGSSFITVVRSHGCRTRSQQHPAHCSGPGITPQKEPGSYLAQPLVTATEATRVRRD